MGTITVYNGSNAAISVFVSKYSNPDGYDHWYSVAPGEVENWGRDGWELVAFKNKDDSDRAGVYIRTNRTVTFKALDDIEVN